MAITKREFLLYSSSAMALAAMGGAAFTVKAEEGSAAMKSAEGLELASELVIRKTDNLTTEDVHAWMKSLRGHPYVEQSGFDVTSIFKVKADGETYYVGGVNVENTELTAGTCGEEGAIAAAVSAFGQQIDIVEGWVMGAPRGAESSDLAVYPCGECRQRIAQYTAPEAPIHIIGLDGEVKNTQTRAELLPNAFSFRDLEHNGEAAAAPALAPVEFAKDRLFRQPKEPLEDDAIFAWLKGLKADARVSNIHEAIVVRLDNGAYVAGVKVENAAYPSSTNAVQAAMAIMHARFGHVHIEEVWAFGEQEGASKDTHFPISGSGMQILYQFAKGKNVPMHNFSANAEKHSFGLREMVRAVRTF